MKAITVRAIVVLAFVVLSKQMSGQRNKTASEKKNQQPNNDNDIASEEENDNDINDNDIASEEEEEEGDCYTGRKKCVNGGRCEDIGDEKTGAIWFCHCQRYTLGKYCEIVNPCYQMVGGKPQKNKDMCSKVGECSMQPGLNELEKTHTVGKQLKPEDVWYKCDCDDKFTGKDCETTLDCRNQNDYEYSCKNGGTCEDVVKEIWTCTCPPQFIGPTCSVPRKNNLGGPGETKMSTKKPSSRQEPAQKSSKETGAVQQVSLTLKGRFGPELQDRRSKEYQEMSQAIKNFTKDALGDKGTVDGGSIRFFEGSVIAKYNVITNNAGDSPASIMRALRANANRFPLKAYRVDPDSITSRKVAVQSNKDSNDDKDDSSRKEFTVIALVFVAAACAAVISILLYLQCRHEPRPPRNNRWNSNFPEGFARTYRSVSQPQF